MRNLTVSNNALTHCPAGGDILVETAGYIPKEVQLQALVQSGEALQAYRKNLYPEYESDPVDPEFDPTAQKGYDVFDALNDIATVRRKFSDAQRLALAAAHETAEVEPVINADPVAKSRPETAGSTPAVAKTVPLE